MGSLVIASALLCLTLLAAAPASQPALQIKDLVKQLADPATEIREKAAEKLMALRPTDLPALRDVVAEFSPLLPSQRIALHDVVIQVYMAGMPYEFAPDNAPMIGLVWPLPALDAPTEEDGGVVVPERLQGFPAYHALRDGDVITGIKQLPNDEFPTPRLFTLAVQRFHAGQTITLLVIRDGRRIEVPLELSHKPGDVDGDTIKEWIPSRREIAEQYWEENFATLIKDIVL